MLWVEPLEGNSWVWRSCPSHCKQAESTYRSQSINPNYMIDYIQINHAKMTVYYFHNPAYISFPIHTPTLTQNDQTSLTALLTNSNSNVQTRSSSILAICISHWDVFKWRGLHYPKLTSCLIFFRGSWSKCTPPMLISHSWGSCLIAPTPPESSEGLWAWNQNRVLSKIFQTSDAP